MEKVVYVVWEAEGTDPEPIALQLRTDVATELAELGASAVHVNVADATVAHVPGRRPPTVPRFPMAVLSFWLDNADHREPIEAALRAVGGDIAGYVVGESVPLRNTSNLAARGERTPGVNMIALLEKPDWIDYGEWIHRWRDHHRIVALETQWQYSYVRNTVIHPLTPAAPACASPDYAAAPRGAQDLRTTEYRAG
ncbi:MAG: hypothetical protein HZB15_05460 [Actinobacteria bacterium]|nr:hypothetical protein [Actinomycetota bacterium]